jgi:hypothetical protein
MFCINVALGSTSWRLLFKEAERAEKAFAILVDLNGSIQIIEDDFGQRLSAKSASINGVMFEDLDQTKQAHIAMALHQARTQQDAQAAAQADPALSRGTRQQGPAIITPMAGNGMRPF